MRVAWHLALLAGALVPSVGLAQMQLPGALQAPAATGVPGAPPAVDGTRPRPARVETTAVRAPGEETILGHQFQRNGTSGLIAFERSKPLEISRLVLVGENTTRSYEPCRVEISGGKIPVRPAPPERGLVSYAVEMEACPFSIDVLDGAVRVRGEVCEITAASCRVDPTGVWGPPGSSISAEEAKSVERLRGRYEKEVRDLFRAVIAAAGKDRAKQKQIAADQAGFSSRREVACRDYAGEDRHGFCASRITLARAVALSAELHGASPVAKPAPKRPARPKATVHAAPPSEIQ
jgi:hypothetical protein